MDLCFTAYISECLLLYCKSSLSFFFVGTFILLLKLWYSNSISSYGRRIGLLDYTEFVAKSLIAQLTPPSVYNKDLQSSNTPTLSY